LESFEQLASQYEPMIQQIIHSLHIYKNKDEFHHHGLIALWKASKRFDPAKGTFSTYAYHYIKGYLLMELTKTTVEAERTILQKRGILGKCSSRLYRRSAGREHSIILLPSPIPDNQSKKMANANSSWGLKYQRNCR
jgi:RNA polymerase sigma factor (sigma-70 family)